MPFHPKPSAFALMLCLICASALGAAPHRLVLSSGAVSYTHLRAHETGAYLVCRLLLEKKF
ncbi:hypothetical protein D7X55_34175 [Corallococcus sp. AB049A]|nr:hypothetical protein D7X55_34175 [Corallococcus sp. AB049A]